jgi:hypothetical protein
VILTHNRLQYPVGQGFFHVGEVNLGSVTFRYVYDCGSTMSRPLHREVEKYLEDLASAGRVDALFLSHIDNDHVSGLDTLLAHIRVENVFLPLLTPVARLALVAHAIDQDTLTADHLSLLADPGQWLGDRGATNVFFISGGEGPAPDGVIPIGPGEPPQGELRSIGFDIRKLIHISDFPPPDDPDASAGLTSRALAAEKRSRSANPHTYLIPHTTPLFLMINGMSILDWLFIAFVHPDATAESRFQRVVKQTLGNIPKNAKEFRRWVFDLVRTRANRRILRGCYHAANVDVNSMSMSLYSGPTARAVRETEVDWFQEDHPMHPFHRRDDAKCGWLATGDSDLKHDEHRAAFLSHYAQILKEVGTLTLPHHGSKHNFHPALLSIGPRRFVVTSRRGNPHHPHAEVRKAVGVFTFFHVNDLESSAFSESVRRKA